MNCNCNGKKSFGSDFNIKTVGICDVSKLNFDGGDTSNLNWTEISVPEILAIPDLKPEIENIDQVYAKVMLTSIKLIETPFAYRKYPLCNLPADIIAEIQALLTTLRTAFIAIDTSVNVIIQILDDIALIPGIPTTVIQTVNKLSQDLEDALDNITTAVDDLTAAVGTGLASLICSALEALRVALEVLYDLVDSVVGVINAILQQVSPALQALINQAISLVLTPLGYTSLSDFVDTILADIQSLLDDILDIDCNPGYAYRLISNAEGTYLTGRKLIVEGVLKQKIVYTAEVENQSVHSSHYEVPFIAFIIPYAKFENIDGAETLSVYDEQLDACIEISGYRYPSDITVDESVGLVPDLNEEFNITSCIEDIYVKALEPKKVFKNVTVFLKATPSLTVLC